MLASVFIVVWLVVNVIVAYTMSVEKMYDLFVEKQNSVFSAVINLYFVLAWILKAEP